MKKILDNKIDFTKYKTLQLLSSILLILWIINPILTYFFKPILGYSIYYYYSELIYLLGIFGIFIFIYLITYKKIEIKNKTPYILISILVIIGIISTIFANDFNLSLFGESYRREGLLVYIMYIGIIFLATIIKDKKYINYIIKIMIFSSIILSILPLFNSDFTYFNLKNIFHNSNHYGYYLLINMMLSSFMIIKEKKHKKIIYIIAYIFLTYMLVKNNTFGCFLSAIITFICSLIIAIKNKYKVKYILLIILIFILTATLTSHFDIRIGERKNYENKSIVLKNLKVFYKDVNSSIKQDENSNKAGSGRGYLWKLSIKYTLKHPLIGGGMECLKNYYKDYTEIDRPHNIILQVSSFIGIPGAITYISLILYLAIVNLKKLKDDDLNIAIYFTAMAYFISSMFGNSMYYTSPYFMILLGFLIRMQEESR